MNILFLSSWFPFPPDNGSRQRAYYLLQGLAAEHQVTLVAFTDSDQLEPQADALKPLARRIVTLPRRAYQPNRAGALAGLVSPQPRFLVDTFDPQVQETIQSVADSDKFDAIVAGELTMAVYAASLAHPAKIFDDAEAGIFADAYLKARGTRRWRNQLTWLKFSRYLPQLAGSFQAVTVVSPVEQALVRQTGIPSDRLTLVPNGVDYLACSKISASVKPNTLIYNGSVTYDANFDAMRYFTREILPQIRAAQPNITLRITGRASEVAQNELSVDNVVLFTGYVDDIRSLVQASAVCVVPLRMGGGSRLKILEAMALGTPVVSTSKGAEGLNLKPEVELLIADSPSAFAQAVLRLLSNSLLREKLTAAARERVRREYDWRVIQAGFNTLVARVATDRQR